ncbi:MAG: response regulator [Chloroflexi bacterium]|nr:response regulator [Chloroflexota bacterium]MBV9895903.1 response regulator [Chloroflexota bacterium]
MRVLIAEDDSGIRDLLHDLIERQGQAVTLARDGEEAWGLFEENGADVIISDWLMPRVEGPELCRRVRESSAPYAYFIMLTALGDQQHHLTGRKSGADDYLAKPFDMEDLAARMVTAERVVNHHRRREALLRLARQVSTAREPSGLFKTLLEETLRLSELQAGFVSQVADENESVVGQELVGLSQEDAAPLLSTMREVASAAAAQRRPAMQGSCIAVALVHENQLLGTLALGTRDPRRSFTREEAENLETMATFCAAALAALERARLEGVLLAARTAQHELNNRLGVVLGYAEMLAEYPGLPESMNDLVSEIVSGAKELAETVDQLRRVTRIREAPRPSLTGPTLNLHESVA